MSPLPYEPQEKFEIAGFYGVAFIMCIVYIVLSLIFVTLLIILPKITCEFFFVYMMVKSNQVYLLGQESPRRCSCNANRPLAQLFLSTDYDPDQKKMIYIFYLMLIGPYIILIDE